MVVRRDGDERERDANSVRINEYSPGAICFIVHIISER